MAGIAATSVAGAAALSALAVALLSSVSMEVHVRNPWLSHDVDYLAGLLAAVVLTVLLMIWPIRERQKVALVALWTIKAAIALGPALFYEAHYEILDAYTFHENARDKVYDLTDMGWGRGTQNLTLLLQGIYAVCPPSYHLAKTLFAFLGMVGIYLVYLGAIRAWSGSSLFPLFLLALFPGVLFWSSILGKEPLMVLAVGLYIYGLGRFRSSPRGTAAVFFILLGTVLAGAIRIWMIYILLAPLMLLIAADARVGRAAKAAFIMLVLLVGGLFWLPSVERVGVGEVGLVERIDVLSKGWDQGGSAQQVPDFDSYADLMLFAPLGAFAALFRPLPGDVPSIFGMIASLENVLLLSLALLSAIRVRKSLKDPVFVALALLVAFWAAAYGFVSYQNLGTAVRFKTQILPVLLLLLMFPRWNAIAQRRIRLH